MQSKSYHLIVASAMLALTGWGLVDLNLVADGPDRPTTVVYSPWTSRAVAIGKATKDARLIALGWFPFAVTVIPSRPDYSQMARRDGAWFVTRFDLPLGCRLLNL